MAQRATIDQAEALRLRRVRARMKRAKDRLDSFEYRLEALHADRTGAFRLVYAPPLIPSEFLFVERLIACNQRDEKQGCALSAQWMADTAEQRARIDKLRMTPLPEKDPTYTGPMGYAPRALTVGKRRRENYVFRFTPEESKASVAAYVERVMSRKQRGRALLEDFLAESCGTAALETQH